MSDLPSTSSQRVHSSAEKRTVMDALAEAKAKLDENASAASNPSQPMQAIAAALRSIEERSEEHTSELQSLMRISYAVFCLKKKHQHTIDQRAQQQAYHR